MNKLDKELFKSKLVSCLHTFHETGDQTPLKYFVIDNVAMEKVYLSSLPDHSYHFYLFTAMVAIPKERVLKFFRENSTVDKMKADLKQTGKVDGYVLSHPDFICLIGSPFRFPSITFPRED